MVSNTARATTAILMRVTNYLSDQAILDMDIKVFLVVFGTVFLAELGDKTQLATVLFASKSSVSLMTVFVAATLALTLSSGLAVAAGSLISQYVDTRYLSMVAGAGFIVIGIWTIVQA